MTAQQGHKYSHQGREVLALATAGGVRQHVRVAAIDHAHTYPLSPAFDVLVDELTPLPMRYFHGQVPG